MSPQLGALRAAAGRFVRMLALVVAATVVVATVIGLLTGSSLLRAISVGLYLVGSLFLLVAFVFGNRGSVAITRLPGGGILDRRGLRWAKPEEHAEAFSVSALFVALGVLLLVLGVLTDTRYRMF